MPSLPKRPCNEPGCNQLVERGYCDQHKRTAQAGQQQYDKSPERRADNNFYTGVRWRKFMRWFKRRHPFCQVCEAAGRTTATWMGHHIKPRKEYPELTFNEDNVQPLCQSCHSREEARQRRPPG